MTLHFRSALGDAMSRLRTADVAGATALIQRTLANLPQSGRLAPNSGDGGGAQAKTEPLGRLGDVLKALNANRAAYRPVSARTSKIDTDDSDPRFTSRSFRNAAGSSSYKLYVPAEQARPAQALVVMLHGCTQDPDDFARGTRMNALADEFGLIVAYPFQPRSANAQGCWNWFDLRHQQRGSGEPEVLAGLAQELAAEHSIDRRRVFVAGLSAGGAMADVLCSTHPDVFAAAGIHSGLPHGAASDVMTAFAAMRGNARSAARKTQSQGRKIVFHGTADATVHPSNGKMIFATARSDQDALQELTTDTVINGRQVTRSHLALASGAAIAEYWAISGAGHAWSGGDGAGTFTDATGPDASREMIRFFLDG